MKEVVLFASSTVRTAFSVSLSAYYIINMLKKLDTLNESVDNDFETGMTVNKSIISIKKQGPIYGFGTGSRDAMQKTFVDNELVT